jgi:hypothetical protein
MASVRGPDPCLAAGSDPDCVTTNRVRDSTNVVAGPSQLPWPIHIIKRKIGHYYDREKIGQHRKKDTLNQRKSGLLLLFTVTFALFFTPFLS